jgi:hypothetical protein
MSLREKKKKRKKWPATLSTHPYADRRRIQYRGHVHSYVPTHAYACMHARVLGRRSTRLG